ncbi:HlyD family secretion protein [Vibrio superstes]|uniref:Hemolysin secretion protein D n=1 Tax=Vibrio superstes NBRC 103154 TaxID=1219062 RepID=A0A511QP05_9VIBR|nr:biotin/lipoyl-binding protein [Vibrio superstes]GEM79054.1 hemolysin secretion protein D [Vibrio superstes NBRC 103154]
MTLHSSTNKLGKFVLISLLGFGISMVLSDIHAPFTTNAYVQKNVVSVTTQIDGNVSEIYVKNGQYIEKGEPVFAIDKRELVEDKDIAYANMVIIQQHLANLEVEIEQANKKIEKQTEIVDNKRKHYLRYKTLLKKRAIGREQYDDAHLDYLDSVRELEQNKLELNAKEIKLGADGENGGLLLAEALLDRSDRKIAKAMTYAPVSGWLTNLQLDVGEAISSKGAQMAITSDADTNVVANFNEKALGSLENSTVSIVFDAIPGKVFSGRVISKDSAVQFSQHTDNDLGKEAYVQRDERWIRKSQQVRTTIEVKGIPKELISGSKATVMIKPEGYGFWSGFSAVIMKFISLFRYIY